MIPEVGNCEFLHEWGAIPIFVKFLEEGKPARGRLSRRTLGKACVITGILALLIARDTQKNTRANIF
jgi:hypothetical protein